MRAEAEVEVVVARAACFFLATAPWGDLDNSQQWRGCPVVMNSSVCVSTVL
jgi:hypothetical protein